MRVLIMRKGEQPEEGSLGDSFLDIRSIVGGNFEQVYVGDDLLVLMNDEWRMNGPAWCSVAGYDIGGTFLCVGDDAEEEDYASLTDEQVAIARRLLRAPAGTAGERFVEMFLDDNSFSVPASWETILLTTLRQAMGVPGFMPVRVGAEGDLLEAGSGPVVEGTRFYVCSIEEALEQKIVEDYSKIASSYGIHQKVFFTRRLHERVHPGSAQDWLDRLYEIFQKMVTAARSARTPEFEVKVTLGGADLLLMVGNCQPGFFFGFAEEFERE